MEMETDERHWLRKIVAEVKDLRKSKRKFNNIGR